jgi:hypothetical protein
MTTLDVPPSSMLDESAHQFISTFMSHVAEVSGYGADRLVTVARLKTLLLAAIAYGAGGPSTAWGALYRATGELLAAADGAPDRDGAHAYLRAFIRENTDLGAGVGGRYEPGPMRR